VLLFVPIIPQIPPHRLRNPLRQLGLRLIAEVAFQGGGIGKGGHHVAGLHGEEDLFGRLAQGLFDIQDEVEQADGLAGADVVDAVGRWRGCRVGVLGIPIVLSGRRLRKHLINSFHDVIHVGEIALHQPVVEHLDGFARQDGFDEQEVGHIRPAPGAVDGEEAEAGSR